MDKRIMDFIEDTCWELDIKKPRVIQDKSKMPSATALACYDVENDIIYLSINDLNFDLIFSLCHELRHKWQMTYFKDEFFDNYKPVTELGIEKYNLQIAELDANAYAAVVMVEDYGIMPLFEGLSELVKISIINQMDKI